MKTTMKLWLCLGTAVTLSAGCAKQEQVAAEASTDDRHNNASAWQPSDDVFKGDFSGALSNVLAGEGGEGGAGTHIANGVMTIPQLNEAQIEQALANNTLRREHAFALHFQPDGQFSGWEFAYERIEGAKCAQGKPPVYTPQPDGTCVLRHDIQIPDGKWSAKDGKLCTQPTLQRAAEGSECVSVIIALDDVVLVKDGVSMIGKGNELVAGKQVERPE